MSILNKEGYNITAPPQLESLLRPLIDGLVENIPIPGSAMTPEGGVFLEWETEQWIISAEFLLPSHQVELQAVNTNTQEVVNAGIIADKTGAAKLIAEFVQTYLTQ